MVLLAAVTLAACGGGGKGGDAKGFARAALGPTTTFKAVVDSWDLTASDAETKAAEVRTAIETYKGAVGKLTAPSSFLFVVGDLNDAVMTLERVLDDFRNAVSDRNSCRTNPGAFGAQGCEEMFQAQVSGMRSQVQDAARNLGNSIGVLKRV